MSYRALFTTTYITLIHRLLFLESEDELEIDVVWQKSLKSVAWLEYGSPAQSAKGVGKVKRMLVALHKKLFNFTTT